MKRTLLITLILVSSIFTSCAKHHKDNPSIAKVGKSLDNLDDKQREIERLHKKGILTEKERNELAKMKKEVFMNGEFDEVDLGKYLESKGISRVFENFNFDIEGYIYYSDGVGYKLKRGTRVFTNALLENFKFSKCNFSGANFYGAHLKNSTIEGTNFKYPNMRHVKMENVKIIGSDFEDGDFSHSKIIDSLIQSGNYSYNHFYKTEFKALKLENAKFDKNIFIKSDLSQMTVTSKDGQAFSKNTIMDNFSQKKIQVPNDFELLNKETPRVGVIWKQNFIGHTAFKVYDRIKKEKAIPVRIDYSMDKRLISGYWLNTEADKIILDAKDSNETNLTLAQKYLASALKSDSYEEHRKIQSYVEEYLSVIDSLIFVGGLDVQKELYVDNYDKDNDQFLEVTSSEQYLKRDYLEFLFLDKLNKIGMPIFGICRGAHMINVFFGGDLYPHLDIYNGNKRISGRYSDVSFQDPKLQLKNDPFLEIYQPVLDSHEKIYIYANHHQGIKNIAPGFHPSMVRKVGNVDIVYAGFSTEKDKTIWFTQFHPEIEADADERGFTAESGNIFKLFVQKTTEYRKNNSLH